MEFGVIANVFDGWYNYKAAWNALNATITQQEAHRILEHHRKVVMDTGFPQVKKYAFIREKRIEEERLLG